MGGTAYGYIRVSTQGQNISRQIAAMREQKIPQKHIFIDRQSGADFDRPAYRKMMDILMPGDTVFIKSIDRLGRSYPEIIAQWNKMMLEKKVRIVVLDMPLLDTRIMQDDAASALLSGLMLQILSYAAQAERDNLRQRQAEGITEAKARGVRFGRQKMRLPSEFPEVVQQWREKEISCQQALQTLGMGRTSFYRKIKELGL
ncbi:MAG: recombinase family protein [Clostridiales bacterium]|nr:recombinase family protein [Clostridiales bacterium]